MYTVLLSKTFLFLAIQFSQTVLIQTFQSSICTLFSSILPVDRLLSGATTQGQSRPGSDGNEEILCEGAVVYSTAPAEWAIHEVKYKNGVISDNSV